MAATTKEHWAAEAAIKSILSQKGENAFGVDREDTGVALSFDTYTTMRASFYKVTGQPDKMFIRTTYWRAENETVAIYPIAVARKFYRTLLNAGFKAE